MIGRKLVDRLVADGRLGNTELERLTLVDVVAPEPPGAEAEAWAADLADPGAAGRVVEGRPDVIVHLPDSKDLVIDAKVSLTAYERLCAATDDIQRDASLREHVASMRRHVDGLSKRNYEAIPGLRTLDFVLLFVPVEAAFMEAIRADDGLYTYALSKNISLVSPSTLLATLRTVSHLWRIEDRNLNAAEIARQAGALHDSFVLLVNELESLGDALNKAQTLHEGMLKRLGSGRGNLIGRVDRLRKLGADTRKQLSLLQDEADAASDDPDDDV